jgi:hypothetical protein
VDAVLTEIRGANAHPLHFQLPIFFRRITTTLPSPPIPYSTHDLRRTDVRKLSILIEPDLNSQRELARTARGLTQTLSDTLRYSQILSDTLRHSQTLSDTLRRSQTLSGTL